MTDRPPIEERLRAAGQPALPRTAWLEIDLGALVANLGLFRELGGGAAVWPVVKADAYGHGALPVAAALVDGGADGLCVAALDEALALRSGGITAPLLVLYPVPPDGAPAAAAAGIAISAGDPGLLAATIERLDPAGPALTIELEVETGLGRGGFDLDRVAAAATAIAGSPGVRLGGLWSHLQAAEDEALTRDQVARFEVATAAVEAAGVAIPRRHLGASLGLLLGNVPAYDLIRPGLAIYGLVPDELDPTGPRPPAADRLRPVLSLHARPVRVADLPAGQGVSYGPTWRAARPSRIATLPLGYGDGWPRSLSNRTEALVRGVRVPQVGNVAMDAFMLDVTDVPGPPVTPADEVVLIGRQGDAEIRVAELARLRTTNSWEVVTAMSRRLPRVYDAAAGPVGVRSLVSLEDRWLGSKSGTATSATSRSTPS